MDRTLTRQERERLVLDLYYNQGKNTRQIAKEVRMNFRDIGAILNKAREKEEASKDQVEKTSLSTRAYELFSEGKTPIQVAIALQLGADEVSEYHKEYLKLIHRENLNQIYEEIGDDDIEPFVKLYKSAKDAGMNAQHVVKLLAIANNNNDLPAIEHRYQELKKELAILEFQKHNSVIILQELSNQITYLRSRSESYCCSLQEQALQLSKLRIQKIKLQALLEEIEKNDRDYLRIKRTAQQEVESILTDNRVLLRGKYDKAIEYAENNYICSEML